MADAPAFHPDLRRAARWLPRSGIGSRSLRVIRALSSVQARLVGSRNGIETVAVGHGSVRLHRPSSSKGTTGALLWIHGGGLVIGTAAQDDKICRHFAQELGLVVAAVDYRLAPDHAFPAALDDCYDALVWLASQPGVDPAKVAIGGASAGGGLAAALALMVRERGGPDVAIQLLIYPMLDDRSALRSDIDAKGLRLWNQRSNAFGWEAYTGRQPGSDQISGLAAPARADDLTGLPPVWVGVGSCDLFHDEDVAYADRLRQSGVPCELVVVDGAFHGFDAVLANAPVSVDFRASQVRALGSALG